MTTGTSVPAITRSTAASVTAIGRSSRMGRLHSAHLGRSTRRARSTRLSVAQNGHATVAWGWTAAAEPLVRSVVMAGDVSKGMLARRGGLHHRPLSSVDDRVGFDLHEHLG